MEERSPTEHDAQAIAESFLGRTVRRVRRYPTGGSNYVYQVTDATDQQIVVRIAVDPGKLAGFIYWHAHLQPIGVPLPALLTAETDATRYGFPYLILEWLPGHDLEYVYPDLSPREKRTIARRLVAVQDRVGSLPPARGYGYARAYNDPMLHPQWRSVLLQDLARSRRRIRTIGLMDASAVDLVEAKLPIYDSYFKAVQPTAFLDDTSTMNVLIEAGKLRGIIDVDFVCFGDKLLTPALTRMALLSRKFETDYVDFWCEALAMNEERKRIVSLYTALFCVNFMGEIGQRFNRTVASASDPHYGAYLNELLTRLLEEC